MPKIGGGVDAFRSGEARIGGPEDDDDDEVQVENGSGRRWFRKGAGKQGNKKLRWNRFKWVLFCANLLVRRSIFIHLS